MDLYMKKEKKQKQNEEQNSSEVENLRSQLARALADYDNLQKRIERDRDDSKYLSKLVIISRLLPVFDMITDAQKHSGDQGLGIALKVLSDTLKDEGIVEIVVNEGDDFNPDLHEAIDTISDSEKKDGTIAEVTMKGYKFTTGPVIRHSKVKVYKNN